MTSTRHDYPAEIEVGENTMKVLIGFTYNPGDPGEPDVESAMCCPPEGPSITDVQFTLDGDPPAECETLPQFIHVMHSWMNVNMGTLFDEALDQRAKRCPGPNWMM